MNVLLVDKILQNFLKKLQQNIWLKYKVVSQQKRNNNLKKLNKNNNNNNNKENNHLKNKKLNKK